LDTNACKRLKEIATWGKINGEAIYSSRIYSSFSEGNTVGTPNQKMVKPGMFFFLIFHKRNYC